MSTKSSFLLAAAVAAVVAAALGSSGVAGDSVADSCNAIRDFVDVGFCVSRLRSVPGAAAADRRGHLLIAADLAAASGESARGTAAALARAASDAAARDALEACGWLYGSASVPALRLFRGYAAAQGWAAAHSLVLLMGYAGIGCDAALGGGGGGATEGRMGGANGEFRQLSAMATALLNSVSAPA
ncbi:hypothetical protein ACP4OV_022912 [Aristida adscensionis]